MPADELLALFGKYPKVATVEEHFVSGGLGSVVAEMIADGGLGNRLLRLGISDEIPHCTAEHAENLAAVGLDGKGLAAHLGEFFS